MGAALPQERVRRRLAAILAADVVGYSALMERAEEATYAEFERLKRELIEPGLSRHEGRLIKTTGDGALAEFASPLAAMRCAVEIQDRLTSDSSPLRLRVGLNLGDVIDRGDHYGAFAVQMVVRDRSQFELHLQGPSGRYQGSQALAWRALCP
jgi:adenylate cyclase